MTAQLVPLGVDAYLTTLENALHGHPRDKSRLLSELRDGLDDATAAHAAAGLPPSEASMEALRGFGSVEELAQACQPELSVRQVRRTARAVLLTVPALIAFWHVVLGSQSGHLPRAAVLLGEHLAGLAATTAALCALALLVTGSLSRWLRTPRRLPMLIAVAGIVSAAALAAAPLAMAAVSAPPPALWPWVLLAAVVAAVPLRTVVRSAWLCRRCAVAAG